MTDFETYSEAKKRLGEIAAEMELPNISLERSMQLYEEGAKLAKVCYEKLNSAKLKFSELSVQNIGEEQ